MSPKARSLAAIVDDLFSLREQRYALQNQAKELKKKEDAIEERIVKELAESKTTKVIGGKLATAALVSKEKLVVDDWDLVWGFIIKNKAYDLVQRRLSDEAARVRLEEGTPVPGVNKMRINGISLSKN